MFIYSHLVEIRQALEDYQILCITPLETATKKVIGSVAMSPAATHALQGTQESPFMRKFWRVFNVLVLATTLAVNVKGLAQDQPDTAPIHIENSTEIIINPYPGGTNTDSTSGSYSILLPPPDSTALEEA